MALGRAGDEANDSADWQHWGPTLLAMLWGCVVWAYLVFAAAEYDGGGEAAAAAASRVRVRTPYFTYCTKNDEQ
eukprot:COSAG01_NODE_39768_length_472_cov_1.099196_1_plen_73_part_10